MQLKANVIYTSKFNLVALTCLLLLSACSKNKNPDPAHNSQIALDYAGTYVGHLPSADGDGILITITVDYEGFYTKTTEYLGREKENIFIKIGEYTWNKEGNKIVLDDNSSYFVGENVLYHLDQKGNRITGDLTEHYRLNKQ